jgi:hypothetical protein
MMHESLVKREITTFFEPQSSTFSWESFHCQVRLQESIPISAYVGMNFHMQSDTTPRDFDELDQEKWLKKGFHNDLLQTPNVGRKWGINQFKRNKNPSDFRTKFVRGAKWPQGSCHERILGKVANPILRHPQFWFIIWGISLSGMYYLYWNGFLLGLPRLGLAENPRHCISSKRVPLFISPQARCKGTSKIGWHKKTWFIIW